MEGKRTFLPRETCQGAGYTGNLHREVQLTWQESAEAIVLTPGCRNKEGPNMK
jgi:hypothetical protein